MGRTFALRSFARSLVPKLLYSKTPANPTTEKTSENPILRGQNVPPFHPVATSMASKPTARGAARSARSHALQDSESTDGPDLATEDDEVQQAQVQKPRMKWVYNSDHTDPVNFGFMFLVPEDGYDDVPTKSPLPSTETPLNFSTAAASYTGASPLSSSSSSKISSIPAPDFVTEGLYLPIHNKSRSITPEAAQQINPHATFFTKPDHQPEIDYLTHQTTSSTPVSYPQSSSSYSAASPQQFAYRPSPHFAPSDLPLQQQLTPSENLSW